MELFIKNKCTIYSIVISSIIFLYSTIMTIIGLFKSDILYNYGDLYPILLLVTIVFVMYCVITHKKRSAMDCIITAILFVSVIIAVTQCFIYFYRIRTGDFYYSLYYNFPGVLKFNTHWIVSIEPLKYKIENTIMLFDPTLISSAFCVILSVVNNIFIKK